MARRTSVRNRLLDAVDEVLFVEGNYAAPVDLILERSSVSPASLYSQFGSKDGLIAAALERRLDEWIDTWDRVLAKATTAEDKIVAVFVALRSYQNEKLRERWCAFSGVATNHVETPPVLSAILDKEQQILVTRLQTAVRESSAVDPDKLIYGLMTLYYGILTMTLRVPEVDMVAEGEELARSLVRLSMVP